MKYINHKIVLHGLVLIGILVLIGYLIKAIGVDTQTLQNWVDSNIRGQGIYQELLLVSACAFLTTVGFPRQAISFLCGYGFGFAEGSFIALVSTVGGCVMSFYYARMWGRRLVAGQYPKKIEKLDNFIRDNPFTMTLLIRLLPAGSNLITNLAAGVSSVRARCFFAGSALGYIPQTLIFTLIGSGTNVNSIAQIGIGTTLFFFSGMLGIYLYRKHCHGKRLDDETERDIAVRV